MPVYIRQEWEDACFFISQGSCLNRHVAAIGVYDMLKMDLLFCAKLNKNDL